MSTTSVPMPGVGPIVATEHLDAVVPYWTDVWRRFRRNSLAMVSLFYAGLLIVVGFAAPLIARYDPKTIDPINSLQSPSLTHWMGTDLLGRDVYSRIIYGSQISLKIAAGTIVISVAISLFVGALAGYFGGWFDTISMRVADMFAAIPYIVVVLAAITIGGRNVWSLVFAIVAIGWMGTARLYRSGVLQVKTQDYIEAARAVGAPTKRIILRHITPNAIQPIIVSVAFSIGLAILQESVFSFLGVGLEPGTPAWGLMVGDSRDYITSHPHLFFFPAGALVLTVLAFTFIGDGLRDALDPKLRGAE